MTAVPVLRYPYPLGALRPFRANPLRFMARAMQRHGDVVRFRLGPYRTFLFRHPDAVKHVIVDNHANFDKKSRGYDLLRRVLGQGLVTSEGEFWRRQRRIAQPAFHRRRIDGFGEAMVQITDKMMDRWGDVAALGRTFDIAAEMNSLALKIVAKTLLGSEVGNVVDEVAAAVSRLNEFANRAVTGVLLVPLAIPTPANVRAAASARRLHDVVLGLIEARRRSGDDPGDLLSMLMHARDADTGEGMSDIQLRDEVLTIFVAGHETTANALAWTFYLLSKHPSTARRLRAELHDVLGDRPATVADLPNLPLLDRVAKESMRLYPPVWMVDRRVVSDDTIMGVRVRENDLALLSPWLTHRDPRLWPNPEGFDPDRFAPEVERTRPRHAYFPFLGGPRMCIGHGFAMLETKLVTAAVMQRFQPWLVPGHPVELAPYITLRPRYGLKMGLQRIRPRAAAA